MGEQQFFDVDRSVYYESLCADLDHPIDAASFISDGVSDLATTYASDLAPCAAYPSGVNSADPLPDQAGRVVLLASSLDLYAPSEMIQDASNLVPGSVLCVTDRRGHTSYSEPGIAGAVDQFLNDGDMEGFRNQCKELIEP